MQTLKQVRSMTANYFYLQGLRFIPFGFTFLLLAAAQTGWWPSLAAIAPLPQLVVLAVAFALFKAISVYYDHTYGRVHSLPHSAQWTIGYTLALTALVAAMLVDGTLRSPVSVVGLVFSVLLVVYWRYIGGFQIHYPVMALLLAGMSLLPLVHRASGQPLLDARSPIIHAGHRSNLHRGRHPRP